MSNVRRWLGRAIHAIYLRMPFGWKFRLAIKNRVFTALSPMISHTNAYRRWLVHGTHGASWATATAAPAAAQSTLERYVAQLMVGSSTNRSPEYVEILHDSPPLQTIVKAIAFYLPQFHPIDENNAWWGRGFTEWTNVSKAVPQFVGHHQPRLPGELGFYDLRIVDVMRRQVELAKLYGIHGFCFHHYWFSGRRLLERPLDQFIAHPDIDFPFCLSWANENWTRRWDGHDHDVLLGQTYSDDNDEAFIRDLVPYLRDGRYIRIGDRPLVIVYRPSLLPDCRHTLEHWRAYCREHGIGEICLAMVQFDVDDPTTYGFDVAIEFPPHKLGRGLRHALDEVELVSSDYRGFPVRYDEIVQAAMQQAPPDYPLFRGVFPSWDNEARKPGAGYTFFDSTPGKYRKWLSEAVRYATQFPVCGEKVVFINAWNEWAEGAYLEPDRKFGYAYLEATRSSLDSAVGTEEDFSFASGTTRSGVHRVVVVSHDAHPHGAQYLALSLCRELRSMGFGVDAVLLGGGVLESKFAEVASLHQLPSRGGDRLGLELARRLAAGGATIALANSLVSGLFAGDLARAGLSVVSMVHELPGVIREYSLQAHALCVATHARKIIFAAEPVRIGFCQFAQLKDAQSIVRPQGIFNRNRHRSLADLAGARSALRARLAVPDDARVVLGTGYADLRKGIDLFVEAANIIVASDPRNHLVWVGHFDILLEPTIRARVKQLGLEGNVHFPGHTTDTHDYYAGADVFALTSREDPFPSVVIESLDAALPVVAFAGTGGAETLLRRGCGLLVDALDARKFAAACLQLLANETERKRLGDAGRVIVESEFSFRHYLFDLLSAGGMDLPRISVVVPNYNYAHFLTERLRSIADQTIAPFEIIVLDDASTDSSMAVIAELQQRYELRVARNSENSGSVFKQWLRGVEMARGDYVWIAEADDLSDPEFLAGALPALRDPSVVLSYCQSRQIDESGKTLATDYLDYTADIDSQRWRARFKASLEEELENGLAVKNTIPNVSAVVFRREPLLFALSGTIDLICSYRIAGDWLTYLKVLERGDLAFNPNPLNRHRRHSGGVTLASDNQPHLQEVLRMQQYARSSYSVSEKSQAQASAYAEHLYKYFGLEAAENPTLSDWQRLHGLCS